MRRVIMILIVSLCVSVSCSDDQDELPVRTALVVEQPSNFPEFQYDLSRNQPTNVGVRLGKKLFYDGRLAKDGITACGACHQQEFAFTHHGHALSHGVDNGIGFRNAQPMQNLVFQKEFMWDGAAIHLDLQPIIPITSEVEMGESFPSIIQKLKADDEYRKLFLATFDNGKIDSENILKALSQFMVTMVSSNSKYDKYVREESGGTFSAAEKRGMRIFQAKCANCHATDLFTDETYRNSGLPMNPRLNDIGRKRVTGREEDNLKFKVPSLRNIEKTAPYMHDGRFSSLSAVIDHYRTGVVDSPTLDPLLKQDNQLGISISEQEKEDLILFLHTLTDNQFLTDERFAEF